MGFEVILGNKYYLGDLVESITLSESLNEISYRANIKLVATPDLPVITPAQPIKILGVHEGKVLKTLLHPAIVWDVEGQNKGTKFVDVICYDRTIYLSKSEDERLMAAGQTASQRLRLYAKDWNIPMGNIPDTKISLARDVKRTKTIYRILMRT